MNTLLFVKGLIGLIVIVPALIAFLTQAQIRKKIPPIFKANNPALLKWHRWTGRIALGGFVLNSVICLLIGVYPAFPFTPRYIAHSALSVLCTFVFLGKVYVTRRKVKWGIKRIVPWGIALFALHVGIFLTATVFALWARIVGLV